MPDVAEIVPIRPKTVKELYKRHTFTITYIVGEKKWLWEVVHVATTKFSDKADTLERARKAAIKHIDTTLAARGGQ